MPSSTIMLSWTKLGTDIVEAIQQPYVLSVDYFYSYLKTVLLPYVLFASTVSALQDISACFENPCKVLTESAQQFVGHLASTFSSAYSSRSNGKIEHFYCYLKATLLHTVKGIIGKRNYLRF